MCVFHFMRICNSTKKPITLNAVCVNESAIADVFVQWFQASKSITSDLLSRKILFTCKKIPRYVSNMWIKKKCIFRVFFSTYKNICWINSITFSSVDRYKHVFRWWLSGMEYTVRWQSCLTFPSLLRVFFKNKY